MSPKLCAFGRVVTLSLTRFVILIAFIAVTGCQADPVEEVRELQARGDFAASVDPLRELLETHSDDPEIHYLYGLALTAIGLPAQAQWSFRKALESDEWRAKAALRLAAGANAGGNYDAAIESATLVLELEPENLDALLIRTSAKVESRRDYEGALEDAERALELDSENSTALSLKGVALFGLERIEEGRVVVEELERRFREENLGMEDTARYCTTRAVFLKENSEFDAAAEQYDQCLETFPSRMVVVASAVEFFDEQGKIEHSLDILRKALEEAPYSAYRKTLADRLQSMGDTEDAEQLLIEGTQLEAADAVLSSWVYLAHHYLDLEQMEKGVAALESALAAGGDQDPQLRFDHAEALIMAGRLDEAETAAAELGLPAYRELILGRIEYERDRPDKALEHFTEGLRLWPNSAGARYYAALAAERAGDFDRAIAEYRYSIRADPMATDARLRLTQLHAAEGAATLAITTARQGSGRHPADTEAELVAVGVAAETGNTQDMQAYLRKFAGDPVAHAQSVAAAASGLRKRFGARTALRFLLESKLDLRRPINAPALRELVLCAGEIETEAGALTSVETALASSPSSAELQEIRGLALSQTGADPAEIRAAFERALELQPEMSRALLGLARLSVAAGETQQALELFARATASDPLSPVAQREAIELLLSKAKNEEAEQQLVLFVKAHPYDASAAMKLARLRMERGADDAETLRLLQRATRFQGGADAYDLLSELHRKQGDAALAKQASGRAAELRASRAGRPAVLEHPAETPQG